MKSRLCLSLCLFGLLLASPIHTRADEEPEPPTRMTIYPAAEPTPSLKYELLPKFMDRIMGNAAVYYGKVKSENDAFFGHKELRENIDQWRKMPLDKLREEDTRNLFDSVDYFLDRAARCDHCDWQLPLGEEPFYSMLLPQVQEMRHFARILGAQARIQIANGEFDKAVKTLQTGYALGQHVAEGETLVSGLVACAATNEMSAQVQEFVQQPGAPNLYWALTKLPRPLIDLRNAIEAEKNALELSFPDVRNLEQAERTPAEWQASLERFWFDFLEIAIIEGASFPIATDSARPVMLTLLCMKGYPLAKRAMIARGFALQDVEGMPVPQVVLLHTMQTWQELGDNMFKWYTIPYPEAQDGMNAADEEVGRAKIEGREIIPLASLLLPAIGPCRTAVVRTDREIAALRLIEALRIYGASHDGRLPDRLSDVREVPVPVDPVTGRPFYYERDGNTATLRGPALPGRPLNYEITLKRIP